MDPETKKFYCVCCGYATLDEEGGTDFGSYEICKVCFWEDDGVQTKDPNYEGGANGDSLNQAKKNFQRLGACSERSINSVQAPGDRPRNPSYVEPE